MRRRKIVSREGTGLTNWADELNVDEMNNQKLNQDIEKNTEIKSAFNRVATESTLVKSTIPSILISEKNCDQSWSYNIDNSNSKSDLAIV